MRKELLIGCGQRREKLMYESDHKEWEGMRTLDINPDHKPGTIWDLTQLPLPYEDNTFDEIHAYEVLEHTGAQGDYRFFFRQWSEFWRIMKPGGLFFATCPHYKSAWAWGDPSHTRVVQSEQLVFLSQKVYERDVGNTPMSDFRYLYKADFDIIGIKEDEHTLRFVLRALKGEVK